jgi:putative membrane protein
LIAGAAIAACGTDVADPSTGSTSENQVTGGIFAHDTQAMMVNHDAGDGDSGAPNPLATPALALCTDNQVMAILRTLNDREIKVAGSVLDRVSDASVKAFAQKMITDHAKMNADLEALARAAGLGFAENANTIELRESATSTIDALSSLSGRALDEGYVNRELLDHLQALSIGDHMLAPSAKNPRLIASLPQARAVISAHTVLAAQLQTRLEGTCGGNRTTSGSGNTSPADAGAASTNDGGSEEDACPPDQ